MYTNKFSHLIICCLLFLSACAANIGGNDYDVSSVGEISTTMKGVIVSTRTVKVREQDSNKPKSGAMLGGATGAVLGSTVGGGHKMPMVSGVIGGLAGGVAGHLLEKKLSEQDGIEYHIKLTNGDIITLTQGLEPKLVVGQKVLIIKSERGRSRVIADNT